MNCCWTCSPSTATPKTPPIPVAIETSRGLLVAVLRTGKRQVFAINPMAAARYRDRHSVSRKKSDPGDALVLANILRTDMHAHRPLPQDSDLARAIAVLARAQQDATWNRQQHSNQLRSLLRECYPSALDAFATWQNGLCRPEARERLRLAPTPSQAARLSRTQIQAALKRAGRKRGIEAEADRIRGVFRAEWAHQPPPFELQGEVVQFVARQVQVPASELEAYEWTRRTIEYHRAQIRGHLGFRECSVADADKLTAWLAEQGTTAGAGTGGAAGSCRRESIEPLTPGRCDRIVGAALRAAEETLTVRISARLTVESTERIVALVAGADQADDAVPGEAGTGEGEDAPPVLGKIKESPANVSLETMLTEIDKLLAVRVGLLADLFADVAPKVVAGWWARAAVESPFPPAHSLTAAAGDAAGRTVARAGAGDHGHAG